MPQLRAVTITITLDIDDEGHEYVHAEAVDHFAGETPAVTQTLGILMRAIAKYTEGER